ncbi:MAG TPA: DUF1003 domain-containing protein [Alphaproteobacteria bacterium]|nr:DUF1003 domain-containing protein [Alphaproteobacteria bacterium]
MKKGFSIIPKKLKSQYSWGDKVPASGIYECSVCENLEAFKKAEMFSQCQECINRKEEQENKWYVTNELVYFISKNMDIEFDKNENISLRIADLITEAAGTITFFCLHVIWFGGWILLNTGYFGQERIFDPYPFGLLTMIVSLEAIFLSTFILMSQKVASKKQELRAEHEYQINLETEKNVAEILALVKDIREGTKLGEESIQDIKESIAEIAPDVIEEPSDATPTIENVPLEAIEKEHFEEHEQILEEAGIDVIPESAPPVVLEEVKKRRGRPKKKIHEFRDELVEESEKIHKHKQPHEPLKKDDYSEDPDK